MEPEIEPRDSREHWKGQARAWMALTGSDPAYELLNKPAFLELVPPPDRVPEFLHLRAQRLPSG